MSEKGRTTDSGARVLKVLDALKGHALDGLSNGDLAKALGESPSTINRCLNTLIEEGFAAKLDNGRFVSGIKWLQAAQAHANAIDRATTRINELNQRVHAGALR